MPPSAPEIVLRLRHTVATYRILFRCIFEEIEQKTGVKANSLARLMQYVVDQAGCNNFHKVLAYISRINWLRQLTQVMDSTELSAKIQNAVFIYNNLQPYTAILDQENIDIPSKKRLHKLFIKRI